MDSRNWKVTPTPTGEMTQVTGDQFWAISLRLMEHQSAGVPSDRQQLRFHRRKRSTWQQRKRRRRLCGYDDCWPNWDTDLANQRRFTRTTRARLRWRTILSTISEPNILISNTTLCARRWKRKISDWSMSPLPTSWRTSVRRL